MFKKLLLLLLVVAPLSMFAQEKFAYINAQEIFAKMPELKDVETKLATKAEAIKKNMTAIESEYNQKLEEFKKTPTDSITESIAIDRQKQLEQLQDRYENFRQTSQAEYEKEQQSLINPLQEKMKKIIKEVGDENNYSYIFDAGALLHVGTHAVDASKQVKAKLGITN